MIQYHPDTNLLAEYSAGVLGFGQSLGIAAHLYYCQCCRQKVHSLNNLGGALLEAQTVAVPVADDALDKLFARIEHEQPSAPVQPQPVPERVKQTLPPVVAKLVGNPSRLSWQRLSPAMFLANLVTGQDRCQVSLIKIRAGGRVLEHDHRGNEFTVVLKGAFSDQDGVYQAGDFLHRQPGEVHTPAATADVDCLCLAIIDAPLKFTGWLGWLLNPWIKLAPQ